jgi:putative transposase
VEKRALSRKLETRKKRGEKSATEGGSNMAKNVLRVQKLHARLKRMREVDRDCMVSMLVKAKPAYHH